MSAVTPVSGAAAVHFADARTRLRARKARDDIGHTAEAAEQQDEQQPVGAMRLTGHEVVRLLRRSAEHFAELVAEGVDVRSAAAASGHSIDEYA